MKTPDAQAQVAALLDLIPAEEPSPAMDVDDCPLSAPCILCGSYSHHTDDCLQPIIHEPRDVSHLRHSTITAHTVALVSTLLALGDATIGPRAIPIPEGDFIPPPIRRRPNRDVFGNVRSHDAPRTMSPSEARLALASKPGDLERIAKAEAKRARKAARLEAQERKHT